MKPLPPYGRMVNQYPAKNNGLQIHCGHAAWNRARSWNGTVKNMEKYGVTNVVFPANKNPDDFNWSISRGKYPVILHNPMGRDRIEFSVLEYLAYALIKAGADRVMISDTTHLPAPIYVPATEKYEDRKYKKLS